MLVALGIRRVSASWVKVICELEASDSDDSKPNELYKNFEDNHKVFKDFCDFTLLRVTKVLTYAGLVSFILLAVLGYFLFNNPTKKANPTNDFNKMIDSIHACTQQVDNIHQRILAIENKLDNIDDKDEEYNKAN